MKFNFHKKKILKRKFARRKSFLRISLSCEKVDVILFMELNLKVFDKDSSNNKVKKITGTQEINEENN